MTACVSPVPLGLHTLPSLEGFYENWGGADRLGHGFQNKQKLVKNRRGKLYTMLTFFPYPVDECQFLQCVFPRLRPFHHHLQGEPHLQIQRVFFGKIHCIMPASQPKRRWKGVTRNLDRCFKSASRAPKAFRKKAIAMGQRVDSELTLYFQNPKTTKELAPATKASPLFMFLYVFYLLC